MARIIFTIIITITCCLSIHAQITYHSVSGIVNDESGAGMPLLAVKILKTDSSFVKGDVTSDKGIFKIEGIKNGNYILNLSYVGYKTIFKNISVTSKATNLKLGTITMQPEDIMLDEAVIVGKVPDVVAKEDTLEFNAASYKTQPNAVVEDMIKKMPGIEIDEDGGITANGKKVTKILVDGEEFFSDDPKVATKNLPAEMVEKLQVIDRKSDEARFSGVDDGEEETVINLTVKKGMKNGWFGNIQAGGATDARYEALFMANRIKDKSQFSIIAGSNNTNNMGAADLGAAMFSGSSRRSRRGGGMRGENTSVMGGINFTVDKSDKFKVGGDVKYSHSYLKLNERNERENFISSDSSTFDNTVRNDRNKSHNIEMNYRLMWQPDKYTQIELRPSLGYNHSLMNSRSISQSMGRDNTNMGVNDTITTGSLNSFSTANGFNINTRLRASRKLKGKDGRQISLSLSFGYNDSREDGYSYNNTSYYKSNIIDNVDLKDNDRNRGGNFGVRASYIEPINKHTTWSVSYHYRYSYTNADKESFNILPDGSFGDINLEYSNKFRNKFQRHRASTAFNGTYENMNYNVGLDFEPSISESKNLIDSNRDVPGKMQYNFSPFLRYNYKIDKSSNLNIEYKGRTQQPSISQLQPSQSISDPLRRNEGNPDLKASYDNNFKLRYNSYNNEKQRSMSLFVNASYIMNSIVNSTFFNEEGIQITKPVNENGVWNIWSMFLTNMPFKNRKFSFNNFASFGCNRQVGYSNNQKNAAISYSVRDRIEFVYSSSFGDFRLGGNASVERTNNSLQNRSSQTIFDYGAKASTTLYIPGNITFSSDINYNGKSGYSDGYDKQSWMWNAQLSWSFLKQKQASLIVRAYDILNQNTHISRTVTGNYIQDVETNGIGRYVMFSFAYRFNTFTKRGESTPEMNLYQNNRGGGRRF